MGTYVNVYLNDVIIKAEHKQKCFETLTELLQSKNKVRDGEFKTLESLLDGMGFSCYNVPNEDIELIEYVFEKAYEEDTILAAIGPFTKDGGYASLKYEDDPPHGYRYNSGVAEYWTTWSFEYVQKYPVAPPLHLALVSGNRIDPIPIWDVKSAQEIFKALEPVLSRADALAEKTAASNPTQADTLTVDIELRKAFMDFLKERIAKMTL